MSRRDTRSASAGTAETPAAAQQASAPQPLGYDRNIDTYLEVGKSRTFAGALEWPGWCRSGKTPEQALEALLDYGPRYARVLRGTKLSFTAPKDVAELKVVERINGDATTDFGAPGMAPNADAEGVDEKELERLRAVLQACWKAFDQAAKKATGKKLKPSGPRGGGRDVQKMVDHVVDSEAGYLRMVGRKPEATGRDKVKALRKDMLEGLAASAHGQVEPVGPRGGKRWTARYFVRRVAWHALDHAWEIEDRLG